MNWTFDTIWPRVIKICGLGIALWQGFIEHLDRPSILILAGGMMGLQSVVKAAKRSGDNEK